MWSLLRSILPSQPGDDSGSHAAACAEHGQGDLQNLKMILKKRGVTVHTSASVQSVEQAEDGLVCRFTEKDREQSVKGSHVLCAVGRRPNTDGLWADDAAPAAERGYVLVDETFATSIPGVYAIGDLIPGAQLAHAASAQGIVLAERLAGKEPSMDLSVVPGCVYTEPEIASRVSMRTPPKRRAFPSGRGNSL